MPLYASIIAYVRTHIHMHVYQINPTMALKSILEGVVGVLSGIHDRLSILMILGALRDLL
jgi:hypothetical protein